MKTPSWLTKKWLYQTAVRLYEIVDLECEEHGGSAGRERAIGMQACARQLRSIADGLNCDLIEWGGTRPKDDQEA